MERLDKLYIGTNTKMYKTIKDTEEFVSKLYELTADINREEMELFVIPSFTTLNNARKTVSKEQLMLGAQNMCWEEQGQYTGEISPIMLQEIGIDLVMIGHSERRHIFCERDLEENKKVISAIEHGFTALLCVGETEEQKENGISDEILRVQLKCGLKNVTKAMAEKLWIAYEPVWAIGVNGKPASAEYANEKQAVIKRCLMELFGEESGSEIPVLYGGSVNNQNAPELIEKENIDGLFIGRSAWNAENFSNIIHMVMPLFKERKIKYK
ncbi:triose-phosphate isomerase [Clostridium magnum]|uniref:Triosephosphate isomerase n=1 Tax=Clostridium magnum DSM 2767 TaxID=1121326 RepID=A0A162QUN7_9CLOT|nr:triose-phosphate isomerase [Clostridium magnum]KZL88991.1 bifunctional PGK/TIM [Clostridium magnum DSM 2767]SHI23441.1 triosephosphate isomerase [Clostridium magnum DSM 2767]